jgi:hypothetical protein
MRHNKSCQVFQPAIGIRQTLEMIGNSFPHFYLKFEIVYKMYRMRRLLSLGPPDNAIQETYKSGLDREPPESNLSKARTVFSTDPRLRNFSIS